MTAAPATLEAPPEPRAAPGTYAVPAGRGRWRLTLHRRVFEPTPWATTVVAELSTARSRRLEQSANSAATLTFTLDGRSPEAALLAELAQDVYAWRWDDQTGRDRCMFRGLVAQSEDQLTEQANTVNVTCHDYLALLGRRIITAQTAYLATNQDDIVDALVETAKATVSSSGHAFGPASYVPLSAEFVDPLGRRRARGAGVPVRDRQYSPSTFIGNAVENLGQVDDGFGFDVLPAPETPGGAEDELRIFYPLQGLTRPDVVLAYGSTVAGLTRSVNSADYANYWRVVGGPAPDDPDNPPPDDAPEPPPLYAEAWDPRLADPDDLPFGLFMANDDQPDVPDPAHLQEIADGDLAMWGQVVPSYSLSMRPGAYSWANPAMGDNVPLIVHAGRLNVSTYVRVVGVKFSISDDGDEDVELVVGRPLPSFYERLTRADAVVAALTRR